MTDQKKDVLDWSKINLFAHGNYFVAVTYTKANAVQRHLLSVLASKLDVTIANPFDDPEGRYINLDELQYMTALGRSTICDNLAILSGEVVRPYPSIDPTQWWMDKDGKPLVGEPTANQRTLLNGWLRLGCRIYVTRSRRFSERTGLSEATSYGVTSQLIEDYKEAIMTGKVLMNHEPNAKYLKTQGSGSRTPGVREPDSRGPGAGLPGSGSRTLPPSETPEPPAPQGAIFAVDNVLDNQVDNPSGWMKEEKNKTQPPKEEGGGIIKKKGKGKAKAFDPANPALLFNILEVVKLVEPAYSYPQRNKKKTYIPGPDSYTLLNECVAGFLDANNKDVELLQSFGVWLMERRNNCGEKLSLKDFDSHVLRWKSGESSKHPEFEKRHPQVEESETLGEPRQPEKSQEELHKEALKQYRKDFALAVRSLPFEEVYKPIQRKIGPKQKAELVNAEDKHSAMLKLLNADHSLHVLVRDFLAENKPGISLKMPVLSHNC